MLISQLPFSEIEKVRRDFDQMLGEMMKAQTTTWTPAIELQETSEQFIARLIVPGLDKESLDIQAGRKAVAISGKTQRPELGEGEKYLYSEFPVGQFRRVLSLRDAVVNTEVAANYADGVLTITLPKAPETINRVVKVNLAGNDHTEQLEATAETAQV
ncbi:MAG: Hsp20/alpha crystallin family protein [Microcoleaceae cyanobacterium]